MTNPSRRAPTFLAQLFFWPLIAASEAMAAQAGAIFKWDVFVSGDDQYLA
jgi:hypothetical protein